MRKIGADFVHASEREVRACERVAHEGQIEATVRENSSVTRLGAKMMACMREVDFELGSSTGCRVVGFVSKVDPGCGRVGTDRQFFYANGRPVDLPKMSKALNEIVTIVQSESSADGGARFSASNRFVRCQRDAG